MLPLKLTALYVFFFFLISVSWLITEIFMNVTIQPYIILSIIIFWSVYRPGLLTPTFLFCLGFLVDLIKTDLIGFHTIIFLSFYFILRGQRYFFLGQTFFVIYWLTILIFAGYSLLYWLSLSFLYGQYLPYEFFFFNTLISIILFPFLSFLFFGIKKILFLKIEKPRS